MSLFLKKLKFIVTSLILKRIEKNFLDFITKESNLLFFLLFISYIVKYLAS